VIVTLVQFSPPLNTSLEVVTVTVVPLRAIEEITLEAIEDTDPGFVQQRVTEIFPWVVTMPGPVATVYVNVVLVGPLVAIV
jgi:hypothetical protein